MANQDGVHSLIGSEFRSETKSIHGPKMMMSLVQCVQRREHPGPNHDGVRGLIRSEKRAAMAQPR